MGPLGILLIYVGYHNDVPVWNEVNCTASKKPLVSSGKIDMNCCNQAHRMGMYHLTSVEG
jgi:hypothetical protein